MPNLELREIPVTDWAMIERINELRLRVYRDNIPQAKDLTSMIDDFDQIARHWAVLKDGQLAASARLSVHATLEDVPDPENYENVFPEHPPSPIASFNRLVIDPSVRGTGISSQLDLIRLEAAEAMGCRCAVGATSAGERRVTQMLRAGFVAVGIGNRDLHSPWSYLPPPMVLICYLPRRQKVV
jgi:GNAT superfamily N-acetyltransferase